MNSKISGLLTLLIFLMMSCDDNTGSLGWDMMPADDVIKSSTKIYEVTTQSVKVDSVYARSSTGYIGRYTDPNFGYYEASFLTELNCLDNYQFPQVYKYDEATGKASGIMAGDSVVAYNLVVYYSTWFGDSLNACRMSAYMLNDQWKKERNPHNTHYRYTNIDVSKYFDKADLLGSKAYTAHDASIPDSIRNATDSYGQKTFYPNVTFALDKKDGQRILDLNRTHPEYFKNSEAFIENVFPGVYLTSDYGDGTILYVDRVDLKMKMRFHYVDSLGVALKKQVTDSEGVAGEDSLYYSEQVVFASTKEVIQANKFSNSDLIEKKVAEEEHTYVKSPAGIFTAAYIPYDQIYEELGNDTINTIKLVFTNYDQKNEYEYGMNVPTNVLLIRAKDVKDFFENNKINDDNTSYIATHTSSNTYSFANIARLVTATMKEKALVKANSLAWSDADEEAWKEDNKLLLIPVYLTTQTVSSSYYSTSQETIAVEHDLEPTYVKLIGGTATEGGTVKNPLEIEVTYTTFNR